jgi:hypothetical protein
MSSIIFLSLEMLFWNVALASWLVHALAALRAVQPPPPRGRHGAASMVFAQIRTNSLVPDHE